MSHPTGLEGFSWLERTQKEKLWGRKGEGFFFFKSSFVSPPFLSGN